MISEYLVSKGKDPDLVLIESKHAHHGQVNCLLYETIGEIPLLISGSADRTIKLWEPKHAKEQNPCVQTIIGHGGTVCSLFIRRLFACALYAKCNCL